MRHSGKLPAAVVGEILHVVNNRLGAVILNANRITHPDAPKLIEEAVMDIAKYLRSLEHKTEFNSNPFEKDKAA